MEGVMSGSRGWAASAKIGFRTKSLERVAKEKETKEEQCEHS
jgi:hypothetical protein